MKKYKSGDLMQGIYSIRNKVNDKKYIGYSKNITDRWYNHKNYLRRGIHHSIKLQNAWNKYGEDNFIFDMLVEVEDINGIEILEKEFIKKYDSYTNGYNCSEGGEGLPGYKLSDETKQKLSNLFKGRKISDEQKEQIRKTLTGRKHSDSTKKKISEIKKGNQIWLGKKHKQESKDKMARAKLGNTNWLGKHHSKETKSKLSQQMIGKIWSSEEKAKLKGLQAGEKNAAAKLTEVDVINIRIRYLKGDRPMDIIADYNYVSNSTIRNAYSNRSWKCIPNNIYELYELFNKLTLF